MIKNIRTIFEEIKNGENIDLYLTILLALTATILGLAGSVDFNILSSIILATIALIALSLLESRRAITKVSDSTHLLGGELTSLQERFQQKNGPSNVLLTKEFPDFSHDFETARSISILGGSLHSIANRYYGILEDALERGTHLRVAVCAPSHEVVSMQILRLRTITNPELLANGVQSHIDLMKSLRTSTTHTELCEIKTVSIIIPYSLVLVEYADKTARIYVKLLPFRVTAGSHPCFELHSRENEEWFRFFSSQFDQFWIFGTDVK